MHPQAAGRFLHEKRQRVSRSSSVEDDEPTARTTSTSARVRVSSTSRAVATSEREVTSASQRITRVAPTTTPAARTTPATSPSVAAIPSSASAGTNAAEGSTNGSTTSSSNTGLIVGVVVAVVGVILLAGLIFLYWRKRKARKADAFGFGGKQEKPDDEQSFIGAGGLATSHGEKYGMSEISHGSQSTAAPPAWNNSADMGFAPGPHQQEILAAVPSAQGGPFADPSRGFAPPSAAMMHHPADRLSVTNPYTAAQINSAAPVMGEFIESPFEDPHWSNKLFQVTRSFQPSMPDELIIMPGDRVRILMAYDDGWCLGENLDSVPPSSPHQPSRGVFPRDCVEEVGLAQHTIASVPSMPTISEPPAEDQAAMPPANAPLASPIDLPPQAALPLGAARRSQSPTKGSTLQRAPTLPPLNVSGRASQTFAGTSYDGEAATAKPQHLSSSSSLNNDEDSSMLDSFPEIPTNTANQSMQPPASVGGLNASTNVKRTSSLIAGKDSELFAALKLSDQDELR